LDRFIKAVFIEERTGSLKQFCSLQSPSPVKELWCLKPSKRASENHGFIL